MNIVVDHVTKTIHGAVVLQDISLNFESGKVYGLQGENGSGKTMLLRLMCGLIYATEGSVSVNDRRLGKDLDFPESVGVMIESPAFIDEYTGQKNLELLAGLKQLGQFPAGGQRRAGPEGPPVDEAAVPVCGPGGHPVHLCLWHGDLPVEVT